MVTVLNPPTPKTPPPRASDVLVSEHEKRVEAELAQLLLDIRRIGSSPGSPHVLFGELFDDDNVQQYYEALVGTLKCAKKRGVITFEGQMLLKGIHDDVVISIVENHNVQEESLTKRVDASTSYPPLDPTACGRETNQDTEPRANESSDSTMGKQASKHRETCVRQSPQNFTFSSRTSGSGETPSTTMPTAPVAPRRQSKDSIMNTSDIKSSPIVERPRQDIVGSCSDGEAEAASRQLYPQLPPPVATAAAYCSMSDSEADGRMTSRRGRVTLPPIFLGNTEAAMPIANHSDDASSARHCFVRHRASMSSSVDCSTTGRPPAPSWRTRKAKSFFNVTKSPDRSWRRASTGVVAMKHSTKTKESFLTRTPDSENDSDEKNVPLPDKPKLAVETARQDSSNAVEANEFLPLSQSSAIPPTLGSSAKPPPPKWKTRKAKSSLNVITTPDRSSRRASTSAVSSTVHVLLPESKQGEIVPEKKVLPIKPRLTVDTVPHDEDTNESNESTPVSTPTSTKENVSGNTPNDAIHSKSTRSAAAPLNRQNSVVLSREVSMRVDSEVNQLMKDICRVGSNPGEPSVTFGELFDDEDVQNTYEALVGTLRSAKRQGYISFHGQMLFKGMHDDVTIHVTERHTEATA